MNLKELDEFRIENAVKFNDRLNPALFKNDHLKSEVQQQLMVIAKDFMDHLGVSDLDVKDITLSGSNAAFTYTPHSDIDLHIIVDIDKLRNDEVYRELFTSKKVVFNDSHDIKIHGYDVELYVQDSKEPVKSLGEYSVLRDKWIKYPSKKISNFDEFNAREKFKKLIQLIELALRSQDLNKIELLLQTIRKYRQAGLAKFGEFGAENLAYKALRSKGIVDQLYKHRDVIHSKLLSLDENTIDPELNESSGYIPSEKEKNDWRFKTALTVDVKPTSIKDNAKKLGLGNIKRAGIPPVAKSSGKV